MKKKWEQLQQLKCTLSLTYPYGLNLKSLRQSKRSIDTILHVSYLHRVHFNAVSWSVYHPKLFYLNKYYITYYIYSFITKQALYTVLYFKTVRNSSEHSWHTEKILLSPESSIKSESKITIREWKCFLATQACLPSILSKQLMATWS